MHLVRWIACVSVLALSACDEGEDQSSVDAPAAVIDGSLLVDAPGPDATLAVCTGAIYDSCTTSNQCMSNNCKLFNQDQIQVCTQACSAAAPCPMQNGVAAQCNNMGICKPPAANACTPP